ncbi:hypothetical protein EDD90_10175 [Streptomyces sp. Ag109_O5-1]|nr:hypothetical protein EDD90_10175 [Streptomyces sp. Ag109_O5-1]
MSHSPRSGSVGSGRRHRARGRTSFTARETGSPGPRRRARGWGLSPSRVLSPPAARAANGRRLKAEGEPGSGRLGTSLEVVRCQFLADGALEPAMANRGAGLEDHASAEGDLPAEPEAAEDQGNLGERVEGERVEHHPAGTPTSLGGCQARAPGMPPIAPAPMTIPERRKASSLRARGTRRTPQRHATARPHTARDITGEPPSRSTTKPHRRIEAKSVRQAPSSCSVVWARDMAATLKKLNAGTSPTAWQTCRTTRVSRPVSR